MLLAGTSDGAAALRNMLRKLHSRVHVQERRQRMSTQTPEHNVHSSITRNAQWQKQLNAHQVRSR